MAIGGGEAVLAVSTGAVAASSVTAPGLGGQGVEAVLFVLLQFENQVGLPQRHTLTP